MPEYDPTHYPKPMSDDLTRGEAGRDAGGEQTARWPASNLLPETYAGPPPAREYEASGLGHKLTAQALPPGAKQG